MDFLRFCIVFILILSNTVFWCLPVYFVTLIKLISPGGPFRQFLSKILLDMCEHWASFNNFLLDKIANTHLKIDGLEKLIKDQSYLIISNHQSWVDIVLLQRVFNRKVPFLRFFLKAELIWLPFLGLAFWALDFPFMKRYSKAYLKAHPEKKGKDLETTIKTCRKLSKVHFSLLNFPEGTRRNPIKMKGSNFRHLLNPKAGGIAFVLEAFEGRLEKLVDVSIFYPNDKVVNMYDLLAGKIKEVRIKITSIDIPEALRNSQYATDEKYRAQFQEWVNDIWLQKDEWLHEQSLLPATRS